MKTNEPIPTLALDDLLSMAASAIEDLLEHTDPNTSYYSGVWADVPGKLRAAAMLQAGNSPVIPEGYVMVPKEPTDEMLAAAKDWTGLTSTAEVVYIKMLEAAPHLPGSDPATVPDRWIPVSERMPEAGGDMIVFTDSIVMSGVSYTKKKGFYIQALEYDDDEPVDSVTHWMPLPAAPQEVSNEK